MIEWQGKYVCAHCGEEFTRTVYLRKKYMNGNEVMITVNYHNVGNQKHQNLFIHVHKPLF